MAAPIGPLSPPSTGPSLGAPDQFEDALDPALRTPAFRRRTEDEEPIEMEETQIIQLLNSYFDEAETARETGFEPRHDVWEQNLHAFWMRQTLTDRASWQSREVSSAVPNFVERFAANYWQALTQSKDWLDFWVTGDPEKVAAKFAKKLTRLSLDFAGTNNSGQPVPFEYNFGNVCQTGALMMMMMAVLWDERNQRVVTEIVDPRQCYFDPAKRGLYRVRFWEEDRETLLRKAELTDSEGRPLYDVEAIEALGAHHDMDIVQNRQDSSGAGQELSSPRTPILVKEWLVDLIDDSGPKGDRRTVRQRQLVVTANDDRIIRGPEPNPWWHGKDWIVAHPVLQAPLMAPEGRTYVELFRPAAATHENVTNRILDIASMTMNAFEANPEYLDNPNDLNNGIAPNQVFVRAEDAPPGETAIRPIEMGRTVPADLVNVWQATRQEMQEAAAQSDIALGQPVRSGETTATEAALSSQGQSVLNNAIAMGIDLGFLSPLAELVFYTALQKVGEDSTGIWAGLSEDEQAMLTAQRRKLADKPFLVKATGLTQTIARQRRQRQLLGALNVIGGNPSLLQAFVQRYDMGKLLELILEDYGVPTEKLEVSEQERLRQTDQRALQDLLTRQRGQAELAQGLAGPFGGGGGSPPAPAAQGPTAQNQNGANPLANGVPEGLPGEVL